MKLTEHQEHIEFVEMSLVVAISIFLWGIIFLLILAFCAPAQADGWYAGGSVGHSIFKSVSVPPNTPGKSGNLDIWDTTIVPRIQVGYEHDRLLLETGTGLLGRRVSRNFGTIQGRPSPCCDITQDIRADYTYISTGYQYHLSRWTPFGMIGLANVNVSNHESGTNENGPGQDFKDKFSEYDLLLIAGAKYNVSDKIRLRADWTGMRNVGRGSTHVGGMISVDIFSLGMEYKF